MPPLNKKGNKGKPKRSGKTKSESNDVKIEAPQSSIPEPSSSQPSSSQPSSSQPSSSQPSSSQPSSSQPSSSQGLDQNMLRSLDFLSSFDTPQRGGFHPAMLQRPRTPPRLESMEEYEQWVNGPPSDDSEDDEQPPRFTSMDDYYDWVTKPSAGGGPTINGMSLKDYLLSMTGPRPEGGFGPSTFVPRPQVVKGYHAPMPLNDLNVPRMSSLDEYLEYLDCPEMRDDWEDTSQYMDPETRYKRVKNKVKAEYAKVYDPAKKADNVCFKLGSNVYVKSDIRFTMTTQYEDPEQPVFLGPVQIVSKNGNTSMKVADLAHRLSPTIPFDDIRPVFKATIPGYPVDPPADESEAIERMRRGEAACCLGIVQEEGIIPAGYYVNWYGCNPFYATYIAHREWNEYELEMLLKRSVIAKGQPLVGIPNPRLR